MALDDAEGRERDMPVLRASKEPDDCHPRP